MRRPREAATAKHEARKARIGKAYQASKEKGLADIETQTGTRKYELQKRMLQAERDRDAGLAARGDGARGVQGQPGGGAGGADAAGSGRAQALSRATASFVRLLAEAYQKAAAPGAALDENQLLAELRELLGKTQRRPGPLPEVPVAARVQVPAALGAAGAVRGSAGPAAVGS